MASSRSTTSSARSKTGRSSLSSSSSSQKKPLSSSSSDADARMAEVEMYAATARKRASLMTEHDFELRRSTTNDDDDDGDYDEEAIERCDYGSGRSSGAGGHRGGGGSGRGDDGAMGHDERRRRRSPSSRSRKSSSASSSSSRRKSKKHGGASIRGSNDKDERAPRSESKPFPKPRDRRADHANADPDQERNLPVTVPAGEWEADPTNNEEGLPPDMTGTSIGGDANDYATTVSSIDTTDSYVRKQLRMRERRRQEFEARRLERLERRKQAELDGHDRSKADDDDDDVTCIVEETEEEGSYFPDSFCEADNVRSFAEEDDNNNDRGGGIHPVDPDEYFDDRGRDSRSRRSGGDPPPASAFAAGSVGRKDNHNNNRRSSSMYSDSCNQSKHSSRHAQQHQQPPTAVQREECCIKHPYVYLSEQTDVNVWTCMRYCKDPNTGRWQTKKMVCDECLEEEEDLLREEPDHHRRFRRDLRGFKKSDGGRLHLETLSLNGASRAQAMDDDYDIEESCFEDEGGFNTASMSSSSSFSENRHQFRRGSNDENNARGGRGINASSTINVHPSMGDDQTPLERESEAQKRRFVRRLAARAYHFPGNTWQEDWVQYVSNTHLVFGIFAHHPLHPVTGRERCMILLGSVAVGLLISNLIYLWFAYAGYGADDTVLSLGPRGSIDVTKLMITLWTLGSVVHTFFDLSVWHIKACTFCRYGIGGYELSDGAMRCGRTAGMTIVMTTFAFAAYLVLLRASEDYKDSEFFVDELETDGGNNMTTNDEGESFIQPISLPGGGSAKHFNFLLGYIVEFVLAVFVYNPLILTVIFTGSLGCNGRLPVLGGRPREVMREQRHAMKRQRYTMPQVLKLGDEEYKADMWYSSSQKLATNF